MSSNQNRIILLGAGPGDPELLSIKGMKALQQADVVLYDALVASEILDHTSPECKRVFVGKRKGKKEFSQEEINQLLVFYAGRYNCVVRLKGGDPFVFGRGHEELEYAAHRGLNVEIIPGISSALAAPAAVGIPVTKRGVNESFWVVTGTLASGEIGKDLFLAAQSSATVIVLMGMSHLAEIAALISRERSPHEPMAVIQQATWTGQQHVTGRAHTIVDDAARQGIGAPAVIVIGNVVAEQRLPQALAYASEYCLTLKS
ncbi:uroporphyrinogen-III C-methyltransferase [Chryseolinea lacunae]|uniref:uroporphyrinogen-III C-methyltransferase n=1 Tax=Chryseolinea lacunae TaxID=2801331 RepID=A0ABS1KZA2_9BACT|nr:uroporphyrinogen-III C-methyltransferase [Chryseolinea lacunae]MBL0744780.1 uroporphyrinogen-III C-methyltransferase [Chryseolinea lacunae]